VGEATVGVTELTEELNEADATGGAAGAFAVGALAPGASTWICAKTAPKRDTAKIADFIMKRKWVARTLENMKSRTN